MKRRCLIIIMTALALLLSACGGNINVKEGEPANGFLWENDFSEITITGYVGGSNDLKIPSSINKKSVTKIADYAFEDFVKAQSVVIPDSITELGYKAFSGCESLTRVSIGKGLTAITDNAFENCTSLEEVVIPDNIKTIERSAFEGCRALKSITIPHSVEDVKYWALYYCTSLETIYYDGTMAEWESVIWEPSHQISSTVNVYCEDGVKTYYGTIYRRGW